MIMNAGQIAGLTAAAGATSLVAGGTLVSQVGGKHNSNNGWQQTVDVIEGAGGLIAGAAGLLTAGYVYSNRGRINNNLRSLKNGVDPTKLQEKAVAGVKPDATKPAEIHISK